MSETVETCGKAYCEHYPDGLFVCAKCREESTIAHDKACAKIAEARADADHWKGECNALQRMVHEARADIERLNKGFGDGLDTIFAMLIAARGEECDIDILHAEMSKVSKKPSEYIKHVIAERDKLIEQMRGALKIAAPCVKEIFGYHSKDYVEIKAALSAAERGK